MLLEVASAVKLIVCQAAARQVDEHLLRPTKAEKTKKGRRTLPGTDDQDRPIVGKLACRVERASLCPIGGKSVQSLDRFEQHLSVEHVGGHPQGCKSTGHQPRGFGRSTLPLAKILNDVKQSHGQARAVPVTPTCRSQATERSTPWANDTGPGPANASIDCNGIG